MKRVLLLLVLAFGLALALPAAAQTNAPSRTNAPTGANPGGVTFNPNGVFGAIVNQAIRQAAQQAVEEASQPAPTTRTMPDKTPTKTIPIKSIPVKTPSIFRDVPLPEPRPEIFGGRPILADAPYDPASVLVMRQFDPVDGAALDASIETTLHLELLDTRLFALADVVVMRYRIADGRTVTNVLEALRRIPGVLAAQPQYLYRGAASSAPADMTSLQYAPHKLNALIAREAGEGTGVTIGLIDTGIDLDQPVFAGADIAAFDVMADRPVENRDHGTALAGLMLARTGFNGIAPGARLVAVRAFDLGPDGSAISGSFEIASAIELAIGEGAQVLNLSFAGPRDPLVLSELDAAAEKGVIVVGAAGNGGPDAPPAYPGAHRDAIAVTATDNGDALFSGANRGFYIAVSAPGVDVLSPMPGGNFELLSGTSIAAAHVSAVVALMLERAPELSRDRIVSILAGSARDLGAAGPDAEYGAGLADAAAAVAAIE